ncbi:uncharacterized protein LOC125499998 [Athalia rosae]|uniref:uncharacterized protein LOC125499998 n=1 Tax=Athalia rosae TaxID=37344 RepID=UPI0020338D4A|nr:uncharacterized protein LOC125499998 [Athalia rosae]
MVAFQSTQPCRLRIVMITCHYNYSFIQVIASLVSESETVRGSKATVFRYLQFPGLDNKSKQLRSYVSVLFQYGYSVSKENAEKSLGFSVRFAMLLFDRTSHVMSILSHF